MFGPARERALAVPNGVARIFGDGVAAIHAGFFARYQQQVDTRALSATKHKQALSDEWEHFKLFIVDEMSMVSPTLLNAV